MAKILVTGGTGYIGSHTVVELLNAGHQVVIADNLSNSDVAVVGYIETITGQKPAFYKTELCNRAEIDELLDKEKNIDAVIHFAAFLQVHESVEQPLKYYHNNVFSLVNLLQSMAAHGIAKIVFSSSCTVYGNPDTLPVNESAPVKKAESAYGNTKQMGEEILEHSCKAGLMQAISLRYFNPVGAHESALIGEVQHGVPHHLVPYITEIAAGKRSHLNVFGNDYHTPDGTCVRDYIHVLDVATAHIAAVERLVQQKNKHSYEIFNIGTGTGCSVLQMIESFERATGIKIPYKIAARRAGDVEAVFADTQLAEQELGWKARYNVDDMLRSAWNWEKKEMRNAE